MLRQNQYSKEEKCLVHTYILATKNPNHPSAVPCNIEATVPSTNTAVQITYLFEEYS